MSVPAAGGRAGSWALRLVAALLLLTAALIAGGRGEAATASAALHSAAALHSGSAFHPGSPPRLVDAAPHHTDAQIKRDRVGFDFGLLPLGAPSRGGRALVSRRRALVPGVGPGQKRAPERGLSLFRRRIPRMNSEEPPCG